MSSPYFGIYLGISVEVPCFFLISLQFYNKNSRIIKKFEILKYDRRETMKKILSLLAISAAALSLVACGGNKDENKPTPTPSVEPSKDDKPTGDKTSTNTPSNDVEEDLVYTVKLLLPDGTTYTGEGVQIQLCAAQCLNPAKTGADGIVKFDERKSHIDPEEVYNVHIYKDEVEFLNKYAYNINAYKAHSNNKNVEIQLYEKKAYTEGEGTKASPFKLSEMGAYTISLDKKGWKDVVFTATKTGKVSIEAFGEQIEATAKVDTSLIVFNAEGVKVNEVKNGGIGSNFKYEFDAVEGQTYKFAVGAYNAAAYPASFNFVINEVK